MAQQIATTHTPFAQAMAGVTPAVEYGEIKRRFASTKAPPQPTAPLTPGCSRPFKDPAQACVLLNMATPAGRPYSERVAVRILGFFEEGADRSSTEYAKQLEQDDPSCCIAKLPCAQWNLLAQVDTPAGAAAAEKKLQRMLALHTADEIKRRAEFEEHRSALRGDREPTFVSEAPMPAAPEAVEVPEPVGGPVSVALTAAPVPADGISVRDVPLSLQQALTHAVIVVLDDTEDAGREPAIAVLGGFDSDLAARAYVEHVASKVIKDHDIAVVDMYRWIYIDMHESPLINAVERDAELDRIMRKRRAREAEVENFKKMCEELKIEIPYKDVTPDLREDGTLVHDLTEEEMLAQVKSAMTVNATHVPESKSKPKPRWNARINPQPTESDATTGSDAGSNAATGATESKQ